MFRRGLALFLATTMFTSQSFAQMHGTDLGNSGFSDTTVETIRLAQAGPGWLGEIDIDPPVIDHEALESGRSGDSQDFKAIVVDDRGLKHVMLFHRDRSGAQYESVQMQSVEGSDEYTATVATSLGQTRVEYYIEALDTGGNRVLKGFPFFPLVRELTPPTASVADEKESSGSQSRVIYVLLGVAAVGLALALAGGGGGDGPEDDGGPDPTPGTVPLNIEVTPP